MEELYKLKEMLCQELEEYGRKGEMSAGTLEIVDRLAHALKNLDKIIETKEEDEGEYSGRAYPMYGGRSYRGGSYNDGNGNGGSYARGRGQNARRDSMGRYSGNYSRHDGGIVEDLRGLMADAPNDQIKRDMQRLVEKIEQQM